MSYVQCPDCGKRIVDKRRYPVEPLCAWLGMSLSAACLHVGLSGSTQKAARCHGLSRQSVDSIAGKVGAHPSEIWPEVIDHDIEDASKECPECHESFVPHERAPQQKYCSAKCRRRYNDKLAYRTNPEYRERRIANGRAWYAENGEQVKEQRRTPLGRKVSARYQRERYHRDPEARATKIARVASWKRQKKEKAA